MDKILAVMVFALSAVIGYVFVDRNVTSRGMNNKVGYTIGEIVELKDKCEEGLPRNKQCVLVFVVEDE